MKIEIFTSANPGLYRYLQESIEVNRSTHRTASGAIEGLRRLRRKARGWEQSMGQWGTIQMAIDGKPVDNDECGYLMAVLEQYDEDKLSRNPIAVLQEIIDA